MKTNKQTIQSQKTEIVLLQRLVLQLKKEILELNEQTNTVTKSQYDAMAAKVVSLRNQLMDYNLYTGRD